MTPVSDPKANPPSNTDPLAPEAASGELHRPPTPLPESVPYRIGMDPERDAARAESARNLTTGLGGTAVALLTFTLFFLYPHYQDKSIDPNLFQLTVAVIVLSVFFLAFSSVYYGRLVGTLTMAKSTWRAQAGIAGLCQLLGLGLLALQPALVLLTIGLIADAALAFALWVAFLGLAILGRHDFYPSADSL